MASWLVREKRVLAAIVELLEEATRLPKAAGWRPRLLVVKQLAQVTLRWAALPRARFARQA